MVTRKIGVWVLAGILILCLTDRATAHAILLAATPAAQQVTHGPEVVVKLRFNSRIDGKRSRLLLIAADGTHHILSIEAQPSPDTLAAKATGLEKGSYVIRWQVLANDGHVTRGEVPFHVE